MLGKVQDLYNTGAMIKVCGFADVTWCALSLALWLMLISGCSQKTRHGHFDASEGRLGLERGPKKSKKNEKSDENINEADLLAAERFA